MKPAILIAESRGFSPEAAALLGEIGQLTLADLDRPSLLAALSHTEVLWVRLRHRIDLEVFAAAPRLRIVGSPTTGLDHLDLEEAQRRGVQVISLRGEEAFLRDVRATAELTLGLILALLRRLPAAARDVAAGRWDRDRFKGHEIRGRVFGIVGYGRLGRLVGGYLAAFGAKVIACDVRPVDPEPDVEIVSFATLLERADVVSLHVDLCEATTGLLDRQAFALMKPSALLINTSRGDVVDSAALLEALERGHLAGAALDVVAGETAAGVGELALVRYASTHETLLITPHIGGCTYESMEMTEMFLARRICDALGSPR